MATRSDLTTLQRGGAVPRMACCALLLGLAGCGRPQPVEVSDQLRSVVDLAMDAEFVYWVQDDGSLSKTPRDGSGRVEVVAPALDPALTPNGTFVLGGRYSVALDPSSVYFTSFNALGGGKWGATVWKVSKDGGAPVALASYPGQTAVLALDDERVYVAHGPEEGGAGAVEALPKAGGPAVALAAHAGPSPSIAVAGDDVLWFELDAARPALDGGRSTALLSVPKAGGKVRTVAFDLNDPSRLQVVGGDVFWMDRGTTLWSGGPLPMGYSNEDGAIVRAQRNGDGDWGAIGIVTGLSTLVGYQVLGDKLVYFADHRVRRMEARYHGEVDAELASVAYGSLFVADESELYWVRSEGLTGQADHLVRLSPR